MDSLHAQSAPTAQSLIRGSVRGRIRRLKGFRKCHQVPDLQFEAAQDFVRKIGAEDVKLLADRIYSDIREAFGYRRREFNYSCHEGLAEIETPDFSAQIRIDQCPQDPKSFVLTTELTHLHNEAIARNPALHACFNNHCDVLCVDFPAGINVEQKIDIIEDNPALADCLSYEPDGSRFELRLPELDLRIEVDELSIRFQLLTLRNLAKLLEHSQRAFEILTDCNFDLRLTDGT